jgi:SAM-dependent methyltransferase
MSYFSRSADAETPGWMTEYAPIVYEQALTQARLGAYSARLKRIATVMPERGRLLDVGMATGAFAALARADGWKVTGLDISAEACRLAREKGIDAHSSDLLSLKWRGEPFDVIHLHHVFEHFADPRAALDKLHTLLAEGGLLVLEVPSQFESWTRRIVNALRTVGGAATPRSILSIHHPVFYSRRSIGELCRRNRLRIQWCRTYFPERWSGPAYRQLLRLVDYLGDQVGGHGENIEIAVRFAGVSALGGEGTFEPAFEARDA